MPSYMKLGQNYTVQVLVNNNSDEPIPIILRLFGPLSVVHILPYLVTVTVPAKGQFQANFTMVATSRPTHGAIRVTASLWIWFQKSMSEPQIAQQFTANVYGVELSDYAQFIDAVVVIGAICSAVVVGFYLRKYVRSRSGNQTKEQVAIVETTTHSYRRNADLHVNGS